ncbi:hypothetical protein HW932_05755 [Allochromatium humboldtianum]|uniref:Uncharacterized protein n=1 Tax=Allochromatium humboldtianum TaxID=504901 RepID=A0A850RGL3_9GAMM|nr:hypothetical protein [Allochromatium humboldtianum]NVZ08761.1 hypothetical protein [Allochromatium humboldtianum]
MANIPNANKYRNRQFNQNRAPGYRNNSGRARRPAATNKIPDWAIGSGVGLLCGTILLFMIDFHFIAVAAAALIAAALTKASK